MILRKWEKGNAPLDFSPKEVVVWIVLKDVPPTLITPKGVSWLASQVGQPINKFLREGLHVKVCVVKDVSEAPIPIVTVMVEEDEQKIVHIEYPEPRFYRARPSSI
ncbi:hypothetical protein LINPERPRIM_LOCUS20301 [Linum perenne]